MPTAPSKGAPTPDLSFGLGPVLPEDESKKSKKDATTGASAAGMRALTARVIAFYFRAPVKSFFRMRVDYMGFPRAINPHIVENQKWSWRVTTPGLLAHAIKTYGWSFIPNQVLPPLLANTIVGGVLYTSYLQILASLHEPASHSTKRSYPPPSIQHTFAAGFTAGAIQSLIAAPLDALQVRFQTSDMLEGKYQNMWHYGREKLREIGLRGVFAGWSLSFVKDSFGSGVFFGTFEYVKSQCFYSFVRNWYGSYDSVFTQDTPVRQVQYDPTGRPLIKPHYAIEPSFILLGGISASIAQQVIIYPLSEIQNLHLERLELLDYQAKKAKTARNMFQLYYHAYGKTLQQCKNEAKSTGGLRKYLYRSFVWNTLRQLPSTSAGLIVFELVRRKYATEAEAIRIEKDGYDILLT